MKKILPLIVLLLGLGCVKQTYIEYEWTDISARHGENTKEGVLGTKADTLDSRLYVLIVDFEINEINGSLGKTERDSEVINANPIDSLFIYSNVDFNTDYPAGTNLTELFRIKNGSYFTTLPADGSLGYDITNRYLEDFVDGEVIPDRLELMLMKAVETPIKSKFQVRMVLSDSTILTTTSTPVVLI